MRAIRFAWLGLCAGCVLVTCATGLFRPEFRGRTVGGGGLVADPLHHELGSHLAGASIPHSVRLRNDGSRPVTIERVRASRTMWIDSDWNRTIFPGELVELRFRIATDCLAGRHKWRAALYLDGAVEPDVRLSASATVESRISVEPELVDLGRIAAAQRVESRVKVKCSVPGALGNPPLVVSNSGIFSADATAVEDGREYLIRIASRKPVASGPVRDVVMIWPTDVRERIIEIPVVGFVE